MSVAAELTGRVWRRRSQTLTRDAASVMTLRNSPLGAQVRVSGLRLPVVYALRLQEMGIRLGSLAHVTQHGAFGGRVIAVAGSRFALDAGTAALIDVEQVLSLPANHSEVGCHSCVIRQAGRSADG
jgi:Fe2+ transport system protein FeoA